MALPFVESVEWSLGISQGGKVTDDVATTATRSAV
jgi:hypothetical protein